MITNVIPYPRAIRPAPDPLGLYLRPARNDHSQMLNHMASGDAICFGAVFDPTILERHAELKKQILVQRLDAILDPKTQASATIGGYSDRLGGLPWGVNRPHVPADFQGTSGRRIVSALADFAVENGFTQLMAPTHLIRTVDDPWLAADIEVTGALRNYLDRNSGSKIPIIYSLAISGALLRDKEQRQRLIKALRTLPFGSVWLKIDGFGADSTSTAVREYISAASEFHSLGVPLVSDHIGGIVGLSLMAFGAVGGISHGITLGERFNANAWRHPPSEGRKFAPHHRVYIPALDKMLSPKEAQSLFDISSRARSLFACGDTHCCPRGVKDMLQNPCRHFIYQRTKEVSDLGQIPEQLRPQRFLEQHIRPASDKALQATTINWEDEKVAKKLQENRKRLDSLRIALGNHAEKNPPQSFSKLPQTRAAREVS